MNYLGDLRLFNFFVSHLIHLQFKGRTILTGLKRVHVMKQIIFLCFLSEHSKILIYT